MKALAARKRNLPLNIGDVVGRLTIIDDGIRNIHGHRMWECLCSCGKNVLAADHNMKSGNTSSCGCLGRESHPITHGQARGDSTTPEYAAWLNAKRRVTSPRYSQYHNYGGRGITMAPDIFSSFELFFAEVGARPTPLHSIDRIDNNKDYARGNLRWATKSEQARNRQSSKLNPASVAEIVRLAPTMTRAEIGRKFGVSRAAVCAILRGSVWSDVTSIAPTAKPLRSAAMPVGSDC